MLIVVLFGFKNIKSVKNICHTIYFFNNTIIVQVRYIIIETKEFARIGYNGFLFPHEYSFEGRLGLHLSTHAEKLGLHLSTQVLMRKKKPVISNTGHLFSFNSTVSYTYLQIAITNLCLEAE